MKTKEYIYIVPIGKAKRYIDNNLSVALKERFDCPVKMASAFDISRSTYNKVRKQYDASQVLLEVTQKKYPKAKKILAISPYDLYTEGLNFVFGLAQVDGEYCLISTARLDQRFWGDQHNEKLFFERTLKEAVHELGHTFGLSHCSDSYCVMFFSNSLKDTDKKNSDFCLNCKEKITS